MGGGAWPFLVGGLVSLAKSVSEQVYPAKQSHVNPVLWATS